ncbi:hypothetical protein BDV97DRAFT_364827 [Delphinella strobiligena]|nr:hypothetical protein BDV97DRAFT_364827 [Delphinella strobiligena]
MEGSHDELISTFVGITGAAPAIAQTALTSTNWNLEQAVTVFFAGQDAHGDAEDLSEAEEATPQPISTTTRTSQAPPTSSSSNPSRPSTSKMRTIRDLQSHDGSGSESDDDHEQDFFAGGEKSGLAVQNPNRGDKQPDYFNNLVNQARRNAPRPEDEDPAEAAPSSAFTGRAQTLGGDDAPSQVVEDPNAVAQSSRPSLPRVQRTLHLWQDGFSIDDGPLHRFDDPANAPVLALINQGRAPLALLDVQPGQEVDLQLDTHKDQNYVAPKKKYKPFGGSGQRLGSPTPGASTSTSASAAPAQPAAPPAAASSAGASSTPTVNIDDSAPVVTLQIRLGDGSRLQSRFNTTHTVGDVYDFVNRAHTASTTRSYALMTTFPNKDLTDKSTTLGDMPELKRGGVVVQKWTS